MASPNNDAEEENGCLKCESSLLIKISKLESTIANSLRRVNRLLRFILRRLKPEQGEKRKLVEELIREYDGFCVSAVPKECLKTIMLWTGFSSFVSTSFPIDMRGVEVVRVVFVFLAVAFYGSLLGLLMKRNFPKLSFYSGYVSLFSLLFALGMIAFFTVMWVFERN